MFYKKIPQYFFAASIVISIHATVAPTETVSASNPVEATTQLQENQDQLKAALTQVQQHSEQLQNNLSRLTQQIQQAQTAQVQGDKNAPDLKVLNQEQKQFQDALSALQKQEQDLAQNMDASQKRLNDLSTLSQSAYEAPAEQPAAKPELVTTSPAAPVSAEITKPESAPQPAPKAADQTLSSSIADLSKQAAQQLPAVTNPASVKNIQQTQTTKVETPASPGLMERLQDPMNLLRIGGSLVALALFLLGWLFWPKGRVKETQETNVLTETVGTTEVPPAETEYDFLQTPEAPQNKLDLAAGYIEMGQHEEAKVILEAVLQEGNEAEKEAAGGLLKKLSE